MEKIIDVLLSPRFQSFYFRTGAMLVAGFVAFVAENLELFELGTQTTVIIGLILGEITKAINNLVESKPLGFARR